MLRRLLERLARIGRGTRKDGRNPEPDPGDALAARLIALGNAAERDGDLVQACAHYREAVQAAPASAKARLNLGIGLEASGEVAPAVAAFEAALAIAPDEPFAHYNLGRLLFASGAPAAEKHLRAALRARPAFPEAWVVLAAVLEARGDLPAAGAALERALRDCPSDFNALFRYAMLLDRLGRPAEAEAALQRACLAETQGVAALCALAGLLKRRGALAGAERRLREALGRAPEHGDARSELFHVLRLQGKRREALAEIRQLVELQPDRLDALHNCGLLLRTLRRPVEAERLLRRLIALAPDFVPARQLLVDVLLGQARIGDAIEACAAARVRLPQDAQLESTELFALNFSTETGAQGIYERHRDFGARLESRIPARSAPHVNTPDPARRLRVGYVSGDFRFHVVTLFMLPLLERHDRGAVESYCYSVGEPHDDYSRQLKARADAWREAAEWPETELAAAIERDRIDILVDLSGHSGASQLAVFARQPAPVQVTWLGYLNTTGLTRIGYRISDRHCDPPGPADARHSERLIRLPHSQWCYRPFVDAAVEPLPPSLRNGTITFGCFTQPAKLSPFVRRLWAKILCEVPGSRLLLGGVPEEGVRERLLAEFAEAGIAASRIETLPYRPLSEYLASYRDVDIALDTFPYSGGTTTCDTLWMGVPVVTLTGDRSPSRSAASVLSTVGLQDWIAATGEEYVRIAVERAADREGLARLRASLRQRMQASPLMDEAGFARDFERALREAWSAWCGKAGAAARARLRVAPEEVGPEAWTANRPEDFERLRAAGRMDEAIQWLEAALARTPDWVDARYNLAVMRMDAGRVVEAEAAFRRVLELEPRYAMAYRMFGSLLHRQGRVEELIALCRRGRACLPERFDIESLELLALNFSDATSADEIFRRHRAFGERLERSVTPLRTAHANTRELERKLRVGLMSGDFKQHPVALFTRPLLERSDRSALELCCYSSGITDDALTARLRGLADRWRDVATLTDRQLAQAILEDGIDVLVDLSGHSGLSRLEALALRPAPVQVAWLGYLNTTGMTRIQWRITDAQCDPPGRADCLHTERLLRLPHSQWCYRPFMQIEAHDSPPFAANGYLTFGSFNQAAKLSAGARGVWAEILGRVPGSRLVVAGVPDGAPANALIEAFVRRGIARGRLTVLPHLALADYYRTISGVDIALDTFPYSGGTTTCDTLWMGVPVVTLTGDRSPSRSAASVLSTVGLQDWIAATGEEYVRIAVERAADREGLARLRASLRQRMQASPLMDEAGFARDFERALRKAWTDFCEERAA